MQFDSSLCFSKFSPPEYAQTQINGCRIEGIYIPINVQLKILIVYGGLSCLFDKIECEIFKYSAIPFLIHQKYVLGENL